MQLSVRIFLLYASSNLSDPVSITVSRLGDPGITSSSLSPHFRSERYVGQSSVNSGVELSSSHKSDFDPAKRLVLEFLLPVNLLNYQ